MSEYKSGSWEFSGSKRGSFLFQYAKVASEFLENGKSVNFTPKAPLLETNCREELSLSFYSSGTSGNPQIIRHSQSTLRSAVRGLFKRIGTCPFDSVCCLPLWHVGGWMQLERAWHSGGQIFFCDYRDLIVPQLRNKIIQKWISLVPAQLQELIKSETGVKNLKCTKGIFIGGASMSQQLIQKIRSLGLKVFPCYGCSETAGMVTLLDSGQFLNGKEGVGKVLDHAKVRINPTNQLVEINSESLCLRRGDNRYDQKSWLKTPDLGDLDDDGNLIIFGRTDRIINTGGEKVDPLKIEKILYDTGKVSDCLVYGEPDEKWGQRVVACVSPSNIDLPNLKKIISQKLKGSMKPKIWKKMDRLPLSEMGKTNRN